jgi:16S rRNA (guanine527-N7)-methyltransferase
MSPLWSQLAAAASINLSNAQIAQLDRYLDLLFEANATMNLTRITDRAQAQVLHIADALSLLPFLPSGRHTIADIGSGGGVPGLPLAIARPDARVTLIESTQKKAAFLSRTVSVLGLANVTVLPQRVEDVAHSPRRESFDIVTARAVGPLPLLLEWCLPLLKKGGQLLAMKGAKVGEELPASEKALKLLNAGPPAVRNVDLPGTEHHVIVVILKTGRTDPKYPRTPAETQKRPL